MKEEKRAGGRRAATCRRSEERGNTNLSAENDQRKGSRREGSRRNPASDRRASAKMV